VLAVSALLASAHRTLCPVSPPLEGNGEGRPAGRADPPESTTRSGTRFKGSNSRAAGRVNVAPTTASANAASARPTTAREGVDGSHGANFFGNVLAALSPKRDASPSNNTANVRNPTSTSRAEAPTEPVVAQPNANTAGTAANGRRVAGAARAAGVGNPGSNQVPRLNEEEVAPHDDEQGGGDGNQAGESDDEPNDPHEQNAAEGGNGGVGGQGAIHRARPAASLLGLREAERSERSMLCTVAVLSIAILVAAMAGAPTSIRLPGLSKQAADNLCVVAGAATFGYLTVPRHMPVTFPLLWNLPAEAVGSLARLLVGIARWGWSKRGYPTKKECEITIVILTFLALIDQFAF
jgi:hypothetical protein